MGGELDRVDRFVARRLTVVDILFGGVWRGKVYVTKQIEAYAVWEDERWLVITVLVKYF